MPIGLIEYGEFPEIYAHESHVHVVADNVHILLGRWRRVDGVYQPCIVGEIIRPLAAVRRECAMWYRALGTLSERPMQLAH